MSANAVFRLNWCTFRKSILLAVMIAIALLNSGCMGVVLRHFEKGDIGNYSDLKRSMPVLQENMGRLVLYMIDGAPNAFNTIGVIEACTIDNRAYRFMSQTYWYVDLPKGLHRVTATDVQGGFPTIPRYYGKEILDIELKGRETQFIKINMAGTTIIGRFNTYTPVLVSQEIAEPELANLDFYKNFKTKIVIGQSSISTESQPAIISDSPSNPPAEIPAISISTSPSNQSSEQLANMDISNKPTDVPRNSLAILPINASKIIKGQGEHSYTTTKVAVIDKLKKLSSNNQEFKYIYNYYALGGDSSNSKLRSEILSEDILSTLWVRKSTYSDSRELNTDYAIEIGKNFKVDLVFTCDLFGESIKVILIEVATKKVYQNTYYYHIFSGYTVAPNSLDDFLDKYRIGLLK